MGTDKPTVLVVDDDRELADLYAAWLTDACDVRVTYSGAEALDTLDSNVDVVLLDRLMPGISGDEVVSRAHEQGYDCPVAMVTAVRPDFDILELGFDEYIIKPIRYEELHDVVDSLLSRATYDVQLQELYSLVSKRAALEAGKRRFELEREPAYHELAARIRRLETELDETTSKLTERDFEVELRKIGIGTCV